MSVRAWFTLLLLVVGLRLVAVDAHAHPRGDVLLDVGVARELTEGQGFASGFERGLVRVAGADTPLPPQGRADQHPPLWPALGALPAWLGLSPFAALKLLGLLASLALLPLVLRCADRLLEGLPGVDDRLPAWTAALVGLSFVMVDSGGNGSLYAAQALGLLALVELLAAPRVSALGAGLVLGLLVQLNHQCLVLAPLPLVVAALSASPGRRGAALARACGVLVVAALVQLPWWWRNHLVFGDAMFSVNGLYLLYRSGVETRFGVEAGVPVLRLVGELGVGELPRVFVGNLRQNLPWFAAALPLATAGLALPALGAAPSLALGALRRRDARVLGLLGALALLGAASLLWPATKLRYLIPLAPLVCLLAVRALADAPRALSTWLTRALVAGWFALLVLTRDDVTGSGPSAHPERWFALALASLLGAFTLAARAPRRAGAGGTARASTSTGLAAAALLVAAALSVSVALPSWFGDADARPATAYHSTWFLPDVFGRDAELEAERRADAVAALADRAGLPAEGEERGQGGTAATPRVLGPLDLLARPDLELVELPSGLPAPWLRAILEATLGGAGAAGWEPPIGLVLLDPEAAVDADAALRGAGFDALPSPAEGAAPGADPSADPPAGAGPAWRAWRARR